MRLFLLIAFAAVLSACGHSTEVLQSIPGPAGQNGTDGQNGADGKDGAGCFAERRPEGMTIFCGEGPGFSFREGTQLTPVKFCPNDESDYPTTFPEYGFKIDGVMYAVYSQKGGFLTPLPEGFYSSDAIGSECSFYIDANGNVIN